MSNEVYLVYNGYGETAMVTLLYARPRNRQSLKQKTWICTEHSSSETVPVSTSVS
jgi:hypothetical protein